MAKAESVREGEGRTVNDSEILSKFQEGLETRQIPINIFNDDEIHALEREHIFGKSWIFIGHESEVADSGDYQLRYVGDDPLIFIRDENGELRVLFNSCRHRGSKVCKVEKGNTSHFRCPYHGWTYRNTGELVGLPNEQQGFVGIDREDVRLHELRVDTYEGLVFACMDDATPSLEEYLGDVTWYLDIFLKLCDWEVVGEPYRWTVDMNWKIVTENMSQDYYHVPVGHRGALEAGIGGAPGYELGYETIVSFSCGRHSGGMYRVLDEEEVYWGHPTEVSEQFSSEGLSGEQWSLAKRSVVSMVNVFPNITITKAFNTNDPDEDGVGLLRIQQWKPKGPAEIEAVVWLMTPKGAPTEYTQRIAEVGAGAFGPAGNFVTDDFAILRGITDVGRSMLAEKRNVTTNHGMGLDYGGEAQRLDDWPGPGVAYEKGNFSEENSLTFYNACYDTIVEGVENGTS